MNDKLPINWFMWMGSMCHQNILQKDADSDNQIICEDFIKI